MLLFITHRREHMTKKSKKRIRGKAPATLKDVAPAAPVAAASKAKAARAPSKMDQAQALCQRECGVLLTDLVRELQLPSLSAASSLIADLRRKKVDVKCVKRADGSNIYKI